MEKIPFSMYQAWSALPVAEAKRRECVGNLRTCLKIDQACARQLPVPGTHYYCRIIPSERAQPPELLARSNPRGLQTLVTDIPQLSARRVRLPSVENEPASKPPKIYGVRRSARLPNPLTEALSSDRTFAATGNARARAYQRTKWALRRRPARPPTTTPASS
ncbi:MAG: hypothetical protein JWN34_4089 [Bryobacterales bacterium]|nr:hypothetical protein [Bryobacterales bacterium]